MSTVKSIVKHIIDHPGATGAEIADALDMKAKDVQPLIHPYIDNGRIKVEKKPVAGASPVNSYFASQSLVKEIDGVRQVFTRRGRHQLDAAADSNGDFSCGFFTDGRLSIAKNRKSIELTADETSRLLRFIDSINIERITGAAQ